MSNRPVPHQGAGRFFLIQGIAHSCNTLYHLGISRKHRPKGRTMNTETNTITTAAAWAIATVLNQAGMEVNVETLGGRPVWTGATGSQVVAAAYAVIKQGGHLAENLEEIDWLTVSFEEASVGRGSWMSQELTLAPAATR